MKINSFTEGIEKLGIQNIIGVPDSTLSVFCEYINSSRCNLKHYTTVNEGAAIGLATGSYISTGRPACVYMQNSGIGNIVNPLTSIANEEVYGIPMLFVIGWRGEPGKRDEPQHKFMGKITEDILKVLDVEYYIIDKDTTEDEIKLIFKNANIALNNNKQYAVIVKKETFDKENKIDYVNDNKILRENAIERIIKSIDDEPIISTTGKISREVYEQCDLIKGHHNQAFLTVGGMGHASMIALGVAQNLTDKKVYCIDGDGATLMHMGNMAFIANNKVNNMVHICLNNNAHESVGGMPTGCLNASYSNLAKACGYDEVYEISTLGELDSVLDDIKESEKLVFIEIKVAMGSRSDLGRPKESATENKTNFMNYYEVTKNE